MSYLGRGASLSDLLLGIHTELFGFQEFRVPILTTSPGRVEDLIEVNKRFNNGEGSELFLFADRVSLCASLHVLEHLWINGRGERVTLLGTRTAQGSRALALLASVIETCRKRNILPWPYLAHVLAERRKGHPAPPLPAAAIS